MNYNINKKNSIVVTEIGAENSYNYDIYHQHDYFEILLFKTGKGSPHIIDFNNYKVSKQSMFIIAPGQVHLLKQNREESGILIQFTKEFLELSIQPSQLYWFFKFNTCSKIDLNTLQFERLYTYLEKLKGFYESSSSFKLRKLQMLFGLFFFEFLEFIPDKIRLENNKHISYEFMLLAIKKFRKVRLVKKYAELLNVSINHLEKQVKKHFGKTPLIIINELLIIEIKRLLLNEQLTHKEITFLLTFDSQASYTRFVKTHTKMTPTQLKKDIKKNTQIIVINE